MGASGHEALVARTRARFNLARIHEMDDPDLLEWASRYGLTADELAKMQPEYSSMGWSNLAKIVAFLSGLSLTSLVAAIVGVSKQSQRWKRLARVATVTGGTAILFAGILLLVYGPRCVDSEIYSCHAAVRYGARMLIALSVVFVVVLAVWVQRGRGGPSLGGDRDVNVGHGMADVTLTETTHRQSG